MYKLCVKLWYVISLANKNEWWRWNWNPIDWERKEKIGIHFKLNIVSGCTGKTNTKLEFMSLLSSKEQTARWNSSPFSSLPYPNVNHRQVTEYGNREVFLHAFKKPWQSCTRKLSPIICFELSDNFLYLMSRVPECLPHFFLSSFKKSYGTFRSAKLKSSGTDVASYRSLRNNTSIGVWLYYFSIKTVIICLVEFWNEFHLKNSPLLCASGSIYTKSHSLA